MAQNAKWAMEYLGLSDINGPLVAVDGLADGGVGFEEMVEIRTEEGTRLGRVAVSYTHLDVYKRQTHIPPIVMPCLGSF